MTRKAKLIDIGVEVAAKGGMSAVTLSEVARKNKCSHGTVAFHFGGVTGLQKAVRAEAIKRKDKRVLAWLRAAGENV